MSVVPAVAANMGALSFVNPVLWLLKIVRVHPPPASNDNVIMHAHVTTPLPPFFRLLDSTPQTVFLVPGCGLASKLEHLCLGFRA